MSSNEPCLPDMIGSALSRLQEGLDDMLTCSTCSCNPALLQTAQAVLQLSIAAAQQSSDAPAELHGSSMSAFASNCQQQHHQQLHSRESDAASACSTRRSSCQLSSSGRRSSLRSAGSSARRRSVSFKEGRSVSFVEGSLSGPQHSHLAPASVPAAAVGGCQPAAAGSDIVVMLPGAAASLLGDALAGSSPVRLEIDLVVHGPAHSKADADGSAPAAAAAGVPTTVGAGQQGARGYARTPSGRVVRRTGSDAGTPLSPSGKEVWAKVGFNDVDAFVPHMAHMLDLAATAYLAATVHAASLVLQLRHAGKHGRN